MAHCPVHGTDRTPSLEIKVGKNVGITIVGCYAGCDKNAVLASVGLTVRDLFADSMPDPKAIREAERQRAKEEKDRQRKRWAIHRTIALRDYWRKRVIELGKLLMGTPSSNRINSQFLSALEKARSLDESTVTLLCQTYGLKPDNFTWGD